MASCKNDFLCILVKVLIIATYGEYCFHLRKSYFENSCHSHTPMSDPFPWEKAAFFFFCFFRKSSALYKIYLLGQNIGTQCYGGRVNKHTISRWYCTLVCNFTSTYGHVHRINAMKSFAKLNKLEEHTSLTNAHISTTKNYTALYWAIPENIHTQPRTASMF